MLSKTNNKILPNGKCSNSTCNAQVVLFEDGEIVIRSRIEKIDPSSGKIRYKCPGCKKWLSVELFTVVFNASLPVSQAS